MCSISANLFSIQRSLISKSKMLSCKHPILFCALQIQNLTSQSQGVNARASECKNASIKLLAETKKRNVEIDGMYFTLVKDLVS